LDPSIPLEIDAARSRNHVVIAIGATIAMIALASAMPVLIQFGAAESFQTRPGAQASDYALGLIWAALLGVSILIWPVRRAMKMPLLAAWLFRVFIAMFASLAYFQHYSIDAYLYFATRNVSGSLWQIGSGNGTRNLTMLCELLRRFSPDSFHAMNLNFAMLGLLGIYLFYQASEAFLGVSNVWIFYLLAFEPSLTFWTSSIGKEAAIFLTVGLYSYFTVTWWRDRRFIHLIGVVAALVLAALVRPWMAAILTLPMILLGFRAQRRMTTRMITIALTVSIVWAALPFLLSMFYLEAAQGITEQIASMATRLNTGDSAGLPILLYGPVDIFRYAPIGMFAALFRPLPGEVLNPFGLIAGVENLFLLGLLARAMMRGTLRDLRNPIPGWAATMVLLWAFIYAFVSSQNLGTAVRYRTQIFPILIGLLLYLGRKHACVEAPPIRV
jgi:hypothetical protein